MPTETLNAYNTYWELHDIMPEIQKGIPEIGPQSHSKKFLR
jgi:hypothetical protein